MKIESVNIIGAGNVGLQLAIHLSGKLSVHAVFTRDESKARELRASHDFHITHRKDEIRQADLNIICVKDSGIAEVAQWLPKDIPVVHTSGGTDIHVLEGFRDYGVLYPVQTFSSGRPVDLSSCPFLLETNSENFMDTLRKFCISCFSERVEQGDSRARLIVHLAAVFANNFSNNMLVSADFILSKHNLSFSILEPLIRESFEKALAAGPLNSQTGPAMRSDVVTMEKHLGLIQDDLLKRIYETVSENIRRFATSS